MSTQVSIWGTNGRIVVDRQEIRTYIRNPQLSGAPVGPGWNTRNITELTAPVNFYLRGEEYSAQIDQFVEQIAKGAPDTVSSFSTAAQTDEVVTMIRRAAEGLNSGGEDGAPVAPGKRKPASFWGRAKGLIS